MGNLNVAMKAALPMMARGALPSVVKVEAELLRRSLHEFSVASWPILEPGTEFVDNWHLEVIDAHLEAVTRGKIRNLIINMPPRCMKSTKVSVQWPAWEWASRPEEQYLTASHADELATRDAFKMRILIESPWYQRRFGETVALRHDQNAKTRFVNMRNGHRIVTSVGGSAIGEGGSRRIADDPHDPKKAMFSAAALKEVIDWWDNTMVSRLNKPKTDATVIMHQRVHQLDLTGHELKNHPGKYEHLCIPMRYDGIVRKTCLGRYDPRKKLGELLWVARFGEAEVKNLERSLGTYGTAAQLQQQPAPLGGGLIKLAWFQEYGTLPIRFDRIVQSWDTAQKDEVLNAFSVCETWGLSGNQHLLLDLYREQVDYPKLKRDAIDLAERDRQRYGRLDAVLIEDKASGISLIQDLQKTKTYRAPIIPIEPEGDKVMRAATSSPTIEAGMISLPEHAPWRPELENEVSKFPNSATKDQVDAMSQYINWSNSRGMIIEIKGGTEVGGAVVADAEDAPWNLR